MASEWILKKVSDMADVVAGGTPSTKNADYYGGDIPWITPKDLSDHKFRYIKCGGRSITNAGLEKSSARLLPKDTILFTSRAPIGYVAIAQQEVSTNQGFKNLVLKSGNDPEFFYYLMRNNVHLFESRASGTTFKEVSGQVVKNTELNVPGYSTQKKISHILSSFDNKIELNRQTNETLEQMAQALFKSWFVDFDPVIDNALEAGNTIPEELQDRAERRQQQLAKPDHQPLPDDIRQLFPSEFELTDELGWVPMGWEINSVGNVIENVGGGTPKTKEDDYWIDGSHAFCTPKDMSNLTSKILLGTGRHLTEAGVSKISSGILSIGTVLMSSRAPIGYLAITDIPVSINQGIIALKQNEKYSSEYLLCWAESNMEEIISRANGSTFLEISKKNFRDIPFIEASDNLLSAFSNIAGNYFKRMTGLQREVDQLTHLRDTLLPKLISGELRLPTDALSDAEQQPATATS